MRLKEGDNFYGLENCLKRTAYALRAYEAHYKGGALELQDEVLESHLEMCIFETSRRWHTCATVEDQHDFGGRSIRVVEGLRKAVYGGDIWAKEKARADFFSFFRDMMKREKGRKKIMLFSKLEELKEKLRGVYQKVPSEAPPPQKETLVRAMDVLHPETKEWCKMLPDGTIINFDDYASAVCTDPKMLAHRKFIMEKDGLQNKIPEGEFQPNVSLVTPLEQQQQMLQNQMDGYTQKVDAFDSSLQSRGLPTGL